MSILFQAHFKNMLKDRYNHKETEKFWQNYWQDKKIHAFKDDLTREKTFVIDTPPPTVSGLLHMGHVFSYTQADFVARFQRMSGKDVFYPIGFDDNGLPTERLVEKVKKIRANQMAREEFVKQCEEVVEEAEKEFEALFNAIALSVDWNEKYQTISKDTQKLSQASFVDLYKKGFIERKFEPVLWDCTDQTALSQADIIDQDMAGTMNEVEFAGENGEKIIIMTTRPELLAACVAVMVHPDDARYRKLHGKNAITPIFGVKVPIVCDDLVQMDKGTGAVMCCTFGDETDIKWFKKHSLKLRLILEKYGKIKNLSPELDVKEQDTVDFAEFKNNYEKIAGKKTKEVSEIILAILKEKNLLLKQTPFTHAVKCAERSGSPIEILVAPQWFVKILDKKELLKKKAKECNWYPEFMRVRIEQWIDGLSWDWCISRQRYFGIPFPIWYSKRAGEEGKIICATVEELPIDPLKSAPKGYSLDEVVGETDIMDTWATSSISPQLSSHAINDEINFGNLTRHKKLFPADLRPQAHEIIRTWAFYTIVKAALHEDSIPWKNLMISGWCLAADKTKMSKSKGNVVTPTALIEEKSSDVVRYFASTSHLGADTAFSEEVFKIGQKLITKLFNSAKFVSLMIGEDFVFDANKKPTETADLWILSKLHATIKSATQEFEKFEYAKAREKIEEFFWVHFCDNYLEIVKVRAYGLKAEKLAGIDLTPEQLSNIKNGQESALNTLYICLNGVLKLFAPFVPHICDELYANIFASEFKNTLSINARGTWPNYKNFAHDENALKIGDALIEVLFEVRKFKSDNNLSMKTTIKRLSVTHKTDLTPVKQDLANVCNAEIVEINQGENLDVKVEM